MEDGGAAEDRITPGQARYHESAAVLDKETSGSGREKQVKSGFARRSAEVRAKGFAPAGI